MENEDVSVLLRKNAEALSYEIPEGLRRKLRPAPRNSRTLVLSSIAASFVCGVLAASLWYSLSGPGPSDDVLVREIGSAHVRGLMANHLTDVASTDQHTVKPWFEGKLDFSPDVRDFKDRGFTLIGGRLDYLDGRNVAALSYQHKLHVIHVFEWPSVRVEKAAPELKSYRGFQIYQWENKGMRYVAVSDLNAESLREFVGMF